MNSINYLRIKKIVFLGFIACQTSLFAHYWENDFLDDLLQCLYAGSMIEVLEKNALAWSIKTENKAKVYTYLKKIYQFDTHLQPSQEAFNEWSYKVKGVAISRDTTFIRYLISYLNNETEYSVVDRSMEGAYGLPPKPPKNPRPIPMVKIRVCDVAFVSLLRAIGQTNDGLSNLIFSLRIARLHTVTESCQKQL